MLSFLLKVSENSPEIKGPTVYLAVRRSHNFRPSVNALLRKRLYDSKACVQNGDPCNKRNKGKSHTKRNCHNKRKLKILNRETLANMPITNKNTITKSIPSTEDTKVQMFISFMLTKAAFIDQNTVIDSISVIKKN